MTARELIAELEQHDMELEVCIGDPYTELLRVRTVNLEEIERDTYFENKLVGQEKVQVIALWR